MDVSTSSTSFVVCALILGGSLSYALFKRHSDPLPLPEDREIVNVPAIDVRPAAVTDAPLLREAAPVSDTVSPSCRVSELEAEVARLNAEVTRLQSETATVRFASTLVALAPADRPVSLVQALAMLDRSDLAKDGELRALFVAQVRPDAALDLLQAEPKFLAALHEAYSKGSPEWRQFEWPAHRDRLLNDFFRQLAEAGLSGRAVELYRVAIADYL